FTSPLPLVPPINDEVADLARHRKPVANQICQDITLSNGKLRMLTHHRNLNCRVIVQQGGRFNLKLGRFLEESKQRSRIIAVPVRKYTSGQSGPAMMGAPRACSMTNGIRRL